MNYSIANKFRDAFVGKFFLIHSLAYQQSSSIAAPNITNEMIHESLYENFSDVLNAAERVRSIYRQRGKRINYHTLVFASFNFLKDFLYRTFSNIARSYFQECY